MKTVIEAACAVFGNAKRYEGWSTVTAVLVIFILVPMLLVWVVNGVTVTEIGEVILLFASVAALLFCAMILERLLAKH